MTTEKGEVLIDVLDYKVISTGGGPFAQLKSGYLRLSGRVYPMVAETAWRCCRIAFENEDIHEPGMGELMYPDVTPEDGRISVLCFPVQRVTRVPSDVPLTQCLVLRQASNHKRGVYTRFGVYDTTSQRVIRIFTSERKDFVCDLQWYEDGFARSITII
jgi:hypothetical protein